MTQHAPLPFFKPRASSSEHTTKATTASRFCRRRLALAQKCSAAPAGGGRMQQPVQCCCCCNRGIPYDCITWNTSVGAKENPALRFRQLAPKSRLHHETQLGGMTIAKEVMIPNHSLGIQRLQKLRSWFQSCQLRPQGSALALQSCILRFQSSVLPLQKSLVGIRRKKLLHKFASFSVLANLGSFLIFQSGFSALFLWL